MSKALGQENLFGVRVAPHKLAAEGIIHPMKSSSKTCHVSSMLSHIIMHSRADDFRISCNVTLYSFHFPNSCS